MPKTTLIKVLILALSLMGSMSLYAGKCLVLGDSQSALSIERSGGLGPALVAGLKERGHEGILYALKGVGASDWMMAPSQNKNTIIGKTVRMAPDQLLPYTLGGHNIALNQTGDIPFLDQLWKQHSGKELGSEEKIDCFMIQLGDNDLFRRNAPEAISEIVKHVTGKDEAPRVCRIIGPTFKESGSRDQYPYITDQKKKFYMTKLRHRLQKEGLFENCPLVDGLNPDLKEQLSNLKSSYTLDGLYYNKAGGVLWAQSILNQAQL